MPISPGAWNVTAKGLNDAVRMLESFNTRNKKVIMEQVKMIGAKIFKDSIKYLNELVYDTPERGYRRTGALRRSGRFTVFEDGMGFKVSYGGAGTNVDYAHYVELGTERMEARPFLRRAVVSNAKVLRKFGKYKVGIMRELRAYGVR